MTTLYRILVILAVAFLIGGVMYAVVGGNGSSSSVPQGGEFPGDAHTRPEGHEEGGERGEGGELPFGWIKSLILMLVGAGLFLGLGRLALLVKPKQSLS